jgi:hypothetical protein
MVQESALLIFAATCRTFLSARRNTNRADHTTLDEKVDHVLRDQPRERARVAGARSATI